LRRAVSDAYYAVFHFLIDQSCRVMIGAQHDQAAYRQVLGRAFSHAVMRSACESFAGGTLRAAASKGLPASFSISQDVRRTATIFLELQDARHAADYDLTERFNRSDVILLIQQATAAIALFQNSPAGNEKRFFLVCLLAWGTLSKR
jgi:hypothetical protein